MRLLNTRDVRVTWYLESFVGVSTLTGLLLFLGIAFLDALFLPPKLTHHTYIPPLPRHTQGMLFNLTAAQKWRPPPWQTARQA